jgi:hypothetical protein
MQPAVPWVDLPVPRQQVVPVPVPEVVLVLVLELVPVLEVVPVLVLQQAVLLLAGASPRCRQEPTHLAQRVELVVAPVEVQPEAVQRPVEAWPVEAWRVLAWPVIHQAPQRPDRRRFLLGFSDPPRRSRSMSVGYRVLMNMSFSRGP